MYQATQLCHPECVTNDDQDAGTAFARALVAEIKAEMGRQEIPSVNALAHRMGVNRAKLNERLNRSRNGTRAKMTMEDVRQIAEVLNIEPAELVRRAYVASHTPPPPGDLGNVI